MEGLSDVLASFPLNGGIRDGCGGKIFGELGFGVGMPEMVESRVGGDAASPGLEIAIGMKAGTIFVDAPECFHGQILSDAGVANDANDPGVDGFLVLPKQRLEGFQVAGRETIQQFHELLSIPNYWLREAKVTNCLERGYGGNHERAVERTWSLDRSGAKRGAACCAPTKAYEETRRSVDVVLLPVKGGVGLDDDVFVGGLLEFVHEHGLASFQGFGDFGMNAKG